MYTDGRGLNGKIEKVPRGIRGEKSSKDMASSRNLVSTIGALASPRIGDGTRCPFYQREIASNFVANLPRSTTFEQKGSRSYISIVVCA